MKAQKLNPAHSWCINLQSAVEERKNGFREIRHLSLIYEQENKKYTPGTSELCIWTKEHALALDEKLSNMTNLNLINEC